MKLWRWLLFQADLRFRNILCHGNPTSCVYRSQIMTTPDPRGNSRHG